MKSLSGLVASFDIVSATDNKCYIKAGERITALTIKKLKDKNINSIILKPEDIQGYVLAETVNDNDNELQIGELVYSG